MKTFARIFTWLFVTCLPLLFISASIACATNSLWLYRYGFEKYGVSSTTGLPPAELEKAATSLIHYFNSTDEYINVSVTGNNKTFELFTKEEKVHFKDVKQLFHLDYWVLLFTLIYALGYSIVSLLRHRIEYRYRLARGAINGSVLTFILMVVLGIGIIINFDRLFLLFHFLVFTNEFWSAQGYMLMLFPGGFWYDVSVFCALATVFFALMVSAIAAIYLKFFHKSTKVTTI